MKSEKRTDVPTPFPLPYCGKCRWYDSIQDDCTVDQSVSLVVNPSEGCPFWESEEGGQQKQSWPRPWKGKHEERISLWRAGKNDYQIAKIVGCTPQAIRYWRKRNDLPRNCDPERSRLV